MKIAVIGGGVSGLSVARMLGDRHKVTVYERDSRPGGLVKCDRIDGHLFHRTGGHVFNSKRRDVLDWFWQQFDRDREFTLADRNSTVILPDGTHVAYPIENHAYMLPDAMQRGFIEDLIDMAKAETAVPANFEEFLIGRFGKTLYNSYFKPYNEKIWRSPLDKVPLSWLEGKLPMPTLYEMIYNNFNHVAEKQFVHSTFYYPRTGGSQFVVDRLAQGLDIRCDSDITSLRHDATGWHVGDEVYDRVIFCGNVKDLPGMLDGVDISPYIPGIENLQAHGTTTVLCEIDENPYSWIYLPDDTYRAHRIICTGNFSLTNRADGRMSATVEFTDEISHEEILENLKRIPMHPRYLAHNFAEYTYPIQAPGTREFVSELKSALEPHGLYLLGRFAEWEYYNMDVAMGAAMDMRHEI